MKKILLTSLLIIICFTFIGCGKKDSNAKYTIITSNYPSYDFVRAIVKDSDIEVKMLLKPGSEMHDYEPTPQDIIDIEKCDMFVYVGGESDSWIDDILSDIDTSKVRIIKLMDLVNLVFEETKEGMEEEQEEEEEYDEHVWTSLDNAITIIDNLKDEIVIIDKDNSDLYMENAEKYINEIKEVDKEIKEVIATSNKKELIFGDRFPLRYFVLQYGLDYYAAFKGCSDQNEASAKTITFLINKVKEDNIKVILKIELSTGSIANTIAKETGAKVLEFHTAHNISQSDFEKGVTYVDIMKRNVEVLKEALK